MRKLLFFAFIAPLLYNCSNNPVDVVAEPTFIEMFQGKWELSGYQWGFADGAAPWNEYILPNERTIIEIVEEQTDFNHWELGDVTAEISVYKIDLITGERMENPILYKWIEFEKEFENFDTYDCHETEKIISLNSSRFTWKSGPGCVGLTGYSFYRRYEETPLDEPNTIIKNVTLDKSLIGNWKITEWTTLIDENEVYTFSPNGSCFYENKLKFNGDGTGEINFYSEDSSGGCSVSRHEETAWGKSDENKYIFNFQVGDKVPLDTVKVEFPDANSLKFISPYDDREYWIWTKDE